MSLNETPSADRVHISFFGVRNAGKSSLVNALTGQEISVVSSVPGTTTDPVKKAMELLPIGPVVILDTPGLDDEGDLGELRVRRTAEMLNRTDLAVLVRSDADRLQPPEQEWARRLTERGIPYLEVVSKADLLPGIPPDTEKLIHVSSRTGYGIHTLKEALGKLASMPRPEKKIITDLLAPGDTVILVMPIDESAPKGRMILPQQQAIRDCLDAGAHALVVRETELASALAALRDDPALVVTDSQAFKVVAEIVPDRIPLTSFSILMARYKGFLETAAEGVAAIEGLKDGDKILMAEGCTHHRQCNDIGTVKIPRWIRAHTKADLTFETSSGRGYPDDLTQYALVVHCGGCMITERDVRWRMRCALEQGVPFTNYGLVIAQMTGTLERSVRLFEDVHEMVVGRG